MLKTRAALSSAAMIAVAVLTAVSAGPAQGDSGEERDKKPTAAVAAAGDRPAPGQEARAKVAVSPATKSALAAIQARIAKYRATSGTKYSFASYTDQSTGNIVIESDASGRVLSKLTDLPGATTAEDQAVRQMTVRKTATKDLFNRRDNSPPFYGGDGIRSGGNVCSSGYTVQNAGTRSMVTAGHCFPNGATVQTESGATTYGTVSNRRLPTVTDEAVDMELVGRRSYTGRIFTGGVNSDSSIPVVAAGTAYVGYNNYCHSGRTTGENCGHTATSINGQVCTQTGCKQPVIVFQGGTLAQGGDSGSPFYFKNSRGAFIRGHVIAGSATTSFAQPWTEVADKLGVSIVKG